MKPCGSTRRRRRSEPSWKALPPKRTWGQIHPANGKTWLSLLDADAPDELATLHALLDAGVLEAWQDDSGGLDFRIDRNACASLLGDLGTDNLPGADADEAMVPGLRESETLTPPESPATTCGESSPRSSPCRDTFLVKGQRLAHGLEVPHNLAPPEN